jgi:hypothetical protein
MKQFFFFFESSIVFQSVADNFLRVFQISRSRTNHLRVLDNREQNQFFTCLSDIQIIASKINFLRVFSDIQIISEVLLTHVNNNTSRLLIIIGVRR